MLFAFQAAPPPLPLIPMPASVQRSPGALPIQGRFVLQPDNGAKDEAELLRSSLAEDGLSATFGKIAGTQVFLRFTKGMPEEGYRLQVNGDGITIEATTTTGLFYGGQTLRQLITGPSIPFVKIEDAPRFGWRGIELDVSRHFFPAAFIKRVIDINARHKMNVFHWHLIDDGGWRMESKAYPSLTKRGAWRSYPPKGKWDYSGIKFPEKRSATDYGGFYSQKEIREVVAYAKKRHVTIVPEIEMPGHCQPGLQCLPETACDNIPAGQVPVAYCPGKEETFKFLQKILDETMALFPSKFIHVGGDEVDKRLWQSCPKCQARMKSEGLKDVDELQSYLIRRIDTYLTQKGRRLVGWDEILEGGLAPGATVMSWRGVTGGIEAAKQGKDVVMSPTSHCYLDYTYDLIPTEMVYGYDPVPRELTGDETKRVLGAQGNVWTEWMPNESDVERMTYPRAFALAEAVWTPLEKKSWAEFNQRLNVDLLRMDRLSLGYRIDAPFFARTAFLTNEDVILEVPEARTGWTLRMSADGSPVSERSPEVTTIRIRPETTMRFAYVRTSDNFVSPDTRVEVRRGGPIDAATNLDSGLMLTTMTGAYNRLPASISGPNSIVTAIDLAKKPAPENFVLRFDGYLRLPQDGDYTFTLKSDDGSRLTLGGLLVVDHDGPHGSTAKSGQINLKKGLYPIRLDYFDGGGASSLAVTVTTPDGKTQAIPAEWLFHRVGEG